MCVCLHHSSSYGLKNYLTFILASDACLALDDDDGGDSSKGTSDDLFTLICFAVVSSSHYRRRDEDSGECANIIQIIIMKR